MKFKKLSLTITFLFVGFSSVFSQIITAQRESDGKVFNFKILESEPSGINTLYAGVDFMGVDLGPGFYMGFGFDANYLFKDKIMFKANYFRPYVSNTDSEKGDYYRDEERKGMTLKLYNKTDIGATFYFAASEGAKNERIALGNSASTISNAVTVLKTRIPTETRYGARAGYHFYQTSVKGEYEADSTALGFAHLRSFSMNSMYVGISATTLKRFAIESNEFGTSTFNTLRNFYLDMLIGLGGTNYFNTSTFDGDEFTYHNYISDKSFDIKRIGWRLGWEKIGTHAKSDKFGLRIGAEIGSRPTPVIPKFRETLDKGNELTTFYFSFKVGFLFSARP